MFSANADADPHAGIVWFNGLRELERAHWLKIADSAGPVDAWAAYLSAEAFQDAQGEAEVRLASR